MIDYCNGYKESSSNCDGRDGEGKSMVISEQKVIKEN